MAANSTMLVTDIGIWQNGGMIVPAIMTLICFVCTAVSLTVSGFICLRDREAQEESDNRAKHHKEQEFVSKVLGLFYKIRASNIFRIQEIMQDLNDERPVWIGKKSEIVVNLEFYGIFLTDREKSRLSNQDEVFEIDCQSLFYFEVERFSKAQTIYGGSILNYFECIHQDGAAFPREFYPDSKPVFNIDIIYNVITEMQVLTELFVLLATGIDLEILSVYAIPSQLRNSKLGDELSSIQDFLFNYYLRVFPQERSSAAVIRKLPDLPIIYEPIVFDEGNDPEETETIETIIEESEESEVIEPPRRKSPPPRRPPTYEQGYTRRQQPSATPLHQTTAPPSRRTSTTSTTSVKPKSSGKGNKFKAKLKLITAYKTLSDRVKEKPSYGEVEEHPEGELEEEIIEEPEYEPEPPEEDRYSVYTPSPQHEPQIRKTINRKTVKKRISERKVAPQTEAQQEELLDEMRKKYKAPVHRGKMRRRGRLYKEETLVHNAFTYMVSRVISFLQERGHLTDEEFNNTKYFAVEKNFIV